MKVFKNLFNPIPPSVAYMQRSAKILVFNLRKNKKIPMSVATMSW